MRCMTPLAVVEHFEVFKHRHLGLLVCVNVLQSNQCGLSGMKDALRHRVIPTGALPAHTRLYPMLGQEWLRAVRAILPATVRRPDASRGGLPLPEGHRQRLVDQLGPHGVRQGPPDHGTRAQSQDDSEIQPAFARREVRNVPHVHGIGLWHRPRAIQLMRRHRLRLPCGPRRFACAPRFAAQACVRQDASHATTAHLQSVWRQPMLETARAVGATPLGTIPRSFVVHLLLSVRVGTGGGT
jgi:hypothetical protein